MSNQWHVVMFSSGAASWGAAKRVKERYGLSRMILLFANVKGNSKSEHAGEDADNYRFLIDAHADIGAQLVIITEGRDLYEVYDDEHMLGNSRIPVCSKQLKQIPSRSWVEATFPNPDDVVLYTGLDWTEEERFAGNVRRWAPYDVQFPLTWQPYTDKNIVLEDAAAIGLKPPRLYEMGFQHANCGGFCCQMGQAQAALLLEVMPERYAYHEQREERFRSLSGKDVSFMKRVEKGEPHPLSLRQFRMEVERGAKYDRDEWGGCGCFSSD